MRNEPEIRPLPVPGKVRPPAEVPLATVLSLALCGILLTGCGLFPTASPEIHSGYRILDFTLLGDSAVALQLETWQVVNPPDTAPWPKRSFALLDRRKGEIRALTDLPLTSAPTFPEWFFACDSGRPVSVHPPGLIGPEGACSDTSKPAVTANGYRVMYADTAGTVHLLDGTLQQFESLATRARRVEVLDAAFGTLAASILEWHDRSDSVLWRGFAVDDPSGSDSVWLFPPHEVRVHGQGTELVCTVEEQIRGEMPCWTPGVGDFNRIFADIGTRPIRPEWDPETGIFAYLDGTSRLVFLDPAAGGRPFILDADPLLSAYRP